LNYGVNMGTFFVFDDTRNAAGDGAFGPNAFRGHGDFLDGTSNTLCVSEVKAYTAYYRDSGSIPSALPGDASTLCRVGDFKTNSGHTEWVDGRAHQTGFTAVFTPNHPVVCTESGEEYNVNWTSYREGRDPSQPTFAAVTSRSYHPGVVNSLLMDGSIRPVSNDIQLAVWRAVATRAGGEVETLTDR
jgi:hypothetical protein